MSSETTSKKRASSKCREWERVRRNRFNDAIAQLGQLIKLCNSSDGESEVVQSPKIGIVQNAITFIKAFIQEKSQLKAEILALQVQLDGIVKQNIETKDAATQISKAFNIKVNNSKYNKLLIRNKCKHNSLKEKLKTSKFTGTKENKTSNIQILKPPMIFPKLANNKKGSTDNTIVVLPAAPYLIPPRPIIFPGTPPAFVLVDPNMPNSNYRPSISTLNRTNSDVTKTTTVNIVPITAYSHPLSIIKDKVIKLTDANKKTKLKPKKSTRKSTKTININKNNDPTSDKKLTIEVEKIKEINNPSENITVPNNIEINKIGSEENKIDISLPKGTDVIVTTTSTEISNTDSTYGTNIIATEVQANETDKTGITLDNTKTNKQNNSEETTKEIVLPTLSEPKLISNKILSNAKDKSEKISTILDSNLCENTVDGGNARLELAEEFLAASPTAAFLMSFPLVSGNRADSPAEDASAINPRDQSSKRNSCVETPQPASYYIKADTDVKPSKVNKTPQSNQINKVNSKLIENKPIESKATNGSILPVSTENPFLNLPIPPPISSNEVPFSLEFDCNVHKTSTSNHTVPYVSNSNFFYNKSDPFNTVKSTIYSSSNISATHDFNALSLYPCAMEKYGSKNKNDYPNMEDNLVKISSSRLTYDIDLGWPHKSFDFVNSTASANSFAKDNIFTSVAPTLSSSYNPFNPDFHMPLVSNSNKKDIASKSNPLYVDPANKPNSIYSDFISKTNSTYTDSVNKSKSMYPDSPNKSNPLYSESVSKSNVVVYSESVTKTNSFYADSISKSNPIYSDSLSKTNLSFADSINKSTLVYADSANKTNSLYSESISKTNNIYTDSLSKTNHIYGDPISKPNTIYSDNTSKTNFNSNFDSISKSNSIYADSLSKANPLYVDSINKNNLYTDSINKANPIYSDTISKTNPIYADSLSNLYSQQTHFWPEEMPFYSNCNSSKSFFSKQQTYLPSEQTQINIKQDNLKQYELKPPTGHISDNKSLGNSGGLHIAEKYKKSPSKMHINWMTSETRSMNISNTPQSELKAPSKIEYGQVKQHSKKQDHADANYFSISHNLTSQSSHEEFNAWPNTRPLGSTEISIDPPPINLPTLVGDLALGPHDKKKNEIAHRIPGSQNDLSHCNNFLSVTQLMNRSSESMPSRCQTANDTTNKSKQNVQFSNKSNAPLIEHYSQPCYVFNETKAVNTFESMPQFGNTKTKASKTNDKNSKTQKNNYSTEALLRGGTCSQKIDNAMPPKFIMPSQKYNNINNPQDNCIAQVSHFPPILDYTDNAYTTQQLVTNLYNSTTNTISNSFYTNFMPSGSNLMTGNYSTTSYSGEYNIDYNQTPDCNYTNRYEELKVRNNQNMFNQDKLSGANYRNTRRESSVKHKLECSKKDSNKKHSSKRQKMNTEMEEWSDTSHVFWQNRGSNKKHVNSSEDLAFPNYVGNQVSTQYQPEFFNSHLMPSNVQMMGNMDRSASSFAGTSRANFNLSSIFPEITMKVQ